MCLQNVKSETTSWTSKSRHLAQCPSFALFIGYWPRLPAKNGRTPKKLLSSCFVRLCLLIIVWLCETRPEDVCLIRDWFQLKTSIKKASPVCKNIHVCCLARGTETVELVTSLGGLGMMRLLAIGQGGRGEWYGSLSWSIVELILMVQHCNLQGTLCLLVRASVLLGAGLGCYVGLWCVYGLG